jgi:hypothetical protein
MSFPQLPTKIVLPIVMTMKKVLFAFLVYGLSVVAFAQSNRISYPYIASAERQEFIATNCKKIKINQTEQEVKQILGTPEEIRPLYEPKTHNPQKIGFTFWYILQRLKEKGSQNDKAEKLVRISFNLDGKVTAIDRWGLGDK